MAALQSATHSELTALHVSQHSTCIYEDERPVRPLMLTKGFHIVYSQTFPFSSWQLDKAYLYGCAQCMAPLSKRLTAMSDGAARIL